MCVARGCAKRHRRTANSDVFTTIQGELTLNAALSIFWLNSKFISLIVHSATNTLSAKRFERRTNLLQSAAQIQSAAQTRN